jgi:hypothetical protein
MPNSMGKKFQLSCPFSMSPILCMSDADGAYFLLYVGDAIKFVF